jgi:hypothetical protein
MRLPAPSGIQLGDKFPTEGANQPLWGKQHLL